MASQVAGPSRLILGNVSNVSVSSPLSNEERQRRIATHKKAERILGAPAPAGLLDESKKSQDKPPTIVLNSPTTSIPSTSFRWDTRMYTNFVDRPSSSSGPAERSSRPSSPSNAQHYVAPLNLKGDPFTKSSSSSSASLDAEVLDIRKDLRNYCSNETNIHDDRPDPLVRSDSSLRRNPRPLPPVPQCVSRPASPASSSSSSTPTGPMRPLPHPPSPSSSRRPASTESVTTIGFAPPSPALKCFIPNASPTTLPDSLSESKLESEEEEKDTGSPVSMVSVATDSTSALSILTPKFGMFMHAHAGPPVGGGSADRKQKHASRVHASPYKLARSASRFSVTSLSSQVSVPPVPPPSELRRRNREKMAKLIRMLGDSPPAEMVFAIESAYAELQASLDKEVQQSRVKRVEGPKNPKGPQFNNMRKPKGDIGAPPSAERPSFSSVSSSSTDSKNHGRSFSLSECSDTDLIYSKKSLSDPDAGHASLSLINSRTTSTSNVVSTFARLRPKKGRSGASERYVVSLGGAEAEKVSLRLAGSGAQMHRKKPSGSYLRGAYKTDSLPVEVTVPPLPNTRVSLLAPKPKLSVPPQTPPDKAEKAKNTQKWLRDVGSTRWEEDDYENIVKSLRKL